MDLSKVIIGCDQLGGSDWGEIKIRNILEALNYAYECGIKRFDTADVYGLGSSEIRLNTLFYQKSDLRVTTKVGVKWLMGSEWERAKTFHDDTINYLKIAIENSLRRIEDIKIDTLLLHWPTSTNNLINALDLFNEYKEDKKIKNYGFCNGEIYLDEILHNHQSKNTLIYQTKYNLTLKNEEYLRKLSKNFKEIQLYGIFAQGILAWEKPNLISIKSDDRRSRLYFYKKENLFKLNSIINKLYEISNSYNVPLAALIICCTMRSLPEANIIIGVRNKKHIDSILIASHLKLTNNDFNYIMGLFNSLNLVK